jgi:hypothetical protein
LLQLSRHGVAGHRPDPVIEDRLRKTTPPQGLALLPEVMPGFADFWTAIGAVARIGLSRHLPPWLGAQEHIRMIALMLSREADVHAVKLLGQDVTDQVTFMTALHHDNEHPSLRIVKPRLEHFIPCAQDRFARHVTIDILHIVGIVDHYNVSPKAGEA